MNLIAVGIPEWFTISGIAIEIVFALVTLLIALYSYKIYKITNQEQTGLFSIAFASISLSYLIQAMMNSFIVLGARNALDAIAPLVFPLSVIAVSLHVVLMLGGLALLAFVMLKEKNPEVFVLFLFLSFAGLLATKSLILTFYLLSSIYLVFITFRHYCRHKKQGTTNSLLVYLGFAFIFIGNFQLALSMFLGIFFLLGHITILIGYFLLLASLLRVK